MKTKPSPKECVGNSIFPRAKKEANKCTTPGIDPMNSDVNASEITIRTHPDELEEADEKGGEDPKKRNWLHRY